MDGVDPPQEAEQVEAQLEAFPGKSLIQVDIVSDLIGPWGWVAKRRLERVMALLDDKYEFVINWQPFLLHPDTPEEGVPNEQPPGGDPDDMEVQLLKELGANLGMEFNFQCPTRPNTTLAHILVQYSKTVLGGAMQNYVVDRLFMEFFTNGGSLDRKDILTVANDAGFDVDDVARWLDDPAKAAEIQEKSESWRLMGVQAIPFIRMNGQSVFSGDQNEAALINTFQKVATKFPMEHAHSELTG